MVNPEDLADEVENYDLDNIDDCNALIEKYNLQLAAALKDVWVLKRMLQLIHEDYLDQTVLNEINEKAVNDLNNLIKDEFTDE